MANIKSSEKKNRQRIKHTARNAAQKSAMRTAVKKLRAAIAAKDSTMSEHLGPAGMWLFYGGITLAMSGTSGIAQERSGLRHPAGRLERWIRKLQIAGGAILFVTAFALER